MTFHEESEHWYKIGWNTGYWPLDKHFEVADPHNYYSKDFRLGLAEGREASNIALSRLASENWKNHKSARDQVTIS